MHARLAVAFALLTAACKTDSHHGVAHAEPAAHESPRETLQIAPPCAGCTLDVPASDHAIPLLVIMHGDRESAAAAAERWRAVTNARGWALLSLQCPRDQGCQDSWWQWGGDPHWITRQVATVIGRARIDRSRVYLAGWSGGGSYIGMYAQYWHETFAAVVIHGGGQPPISARCPAQRMPAYFLVGDENPAHPAAKRLRAYYEKCGEDITWDLIEGADHEQEKAALDRRKSEHVLDWLAQRPRDRISSR
jgi:poly(3-hydroxybutyrate) depolymerase